jgi:hypothetical protein
MRINRMKIEDLYENEKEVTIKIGKTKVVVTVVPLDFEVNQKYDRASTKKKNSIMAEHVASFLLKEFDDNTVDEIKEFLVKKQPKLVDSLSFEVLKLMGMNFDVKSIINEDE